MGKLRRIERLVEPAAEDASRLRLPRNDIVVEREVAPDRFAMERGPFREYQRVLDPEGDGVREVIEYRLAPGVLVPMGPFIHGALRSRPRPGRVPWWAPPQTLDASASTALAVLCALSILTGYLGTLLTQTITFAADEFGTSTGDQGTALAAVRIGVLGSLVITALADQRGRRRFLLGTLAIGCVVSAAGAFSPNLLALSIDQAVVRGLVTAAAVIIAVVASEEVPAGSRAYGLSLIAMSGALGVGMALWVLPLADLGEAWWRSLYLLALLGLPVLVVLGRHLPESRRFVAAEADHDRPRPRLFSGHARRFWLLAGSALLLNVFSAPASQFQNEFLRDERGFSAAKVSLFVLLTNTPGAIGVIAGGRLADLRGRRIVGAVAVIGGTLFTVAVRLVDGWAMWVVSVVAAILASATIPALGVYGPELFPTATRNRVNSIIVLVGVVGSTIGLLVAGRLADDWDFGSALSLLAVAPLLMAVLVLVAYPETARRELEELNPEDRAHPPRDGPGAPIG